MSISGPDEKLLEDLANQAYRQTLLNLFGEFYSTNMAVDDAMTDGNKRKVGRSLVKALWIRRELMKLIKANDD